MPSGRFGVRRMFNFVMENFHEICRPGSSLLPGLRHEDPHASGRNLHQVWKRYRCTADQTVQRMCHPGALLPTLYEAVQPS